MDASCSTSSSNGVFSYVFNRTAGEDECARACSGYWNAFPNRMWVTDLPTNDYEPLEVSLGARGVTRKNSNEAENKLEKKIDVLDQLEAQWAEVKEKLEQEWSSLNEATAVVQTKDDLNTTGVNIFKADDYFEAQSSPFDDFLPNKEAEEQLGVMDNMQDNIKEIKIQKSAELVKDVEKNKEKPVDDLQEIAGQRTGITLFKADDYFDPLSSPFDDFLPNQDDGLDDNKAPWTVYQKSADKKNNQMPNQWFEEISNHGGKSKLKLFKADDYFELQPSPFDYILPLKKNKGSEIKHLKADDYFEPQPSPFDYILPLKKNKGSEIKLFKAKDYFDPQPSVFDYLFSNAGKTVGN